jgi:hypothetical protein
MGATKQMFNDHRQNEIDEAEFKAIKRNKIRKRLIELTKSLTDESEKCKTILSFIEEIEPWYMFDEYVLAVAVSPLWNFERVMKKYSENDTYTIKQKNRLFLEGKLLQRQNEKRH